MTAATPVSALAAEVMAEVLMAGPVVSGRRPRGPELAPVPTPPSPVVPPPSPNLVNERDGAREDASESLAA